ncbi:hypothetical protein D3C72_2256670 [compost metagenome]
MNCSAKSRRASIGGTVMTTGSARKSRTAKEYEVLPEVPPDVPPERLPEVLPDMFADALASGAAGATSPGAPARTGLSIVLSVLNGPLYCGLFLSMLKAYMAW